MSGTVFLVVLSAAVLHAVWNALVKGGSDKHLGMAAVILGHVPFALVVLLFVPPPAPASWPYIALSMALHLGYQFFLLASYRIGDLTQVYPIARGTAPMLVAGVSVLAMGVHLEPVEWLAVSIIAAGIVSMSLVRQRDGLRNGRAAVLALITGCFIAGYSLVDGTGARLAGTALGFYSTLAIGNALVFGTWFAFTRPGLLTRLTGEGRRMFFLGGGASYLAYVLVVWSFTQAPIALVTALRETSIVFALLIGVFVMKERFDLAKLVSTVVTLFGAALLRLSKS